MQNATFPFLSAFGQIRIARPSDAVAIVQMAYKLAAHHGDTATVAVADVMRDAFGQTPWIHLLVAEANGTPVGYAALCGLMQLQFGLRGLDLHHLFTEEGFRGRGIGIGLVEASKSMAKEMSCGYLTVSTPADNLKAQAFYEKTGFVRRHGDFPRFAMRLGD